MVPHWHRLQKNSGQFKVRAGSKSHSHAKTMFYPVVANSDLVLINKILLLFMESITTTLDTENYKPNHVSTFRSATCHEENILIYFQASVSIIF